MADEKPKRKNKPGAGRPRLDIDPEKVALLARIGCTMEEIGAELGCSVDTLERNFAEAIKAGRPKMQVSVRRQQMRLLMAGNATMGIWLGKQVLGQRDRIDNPIDSLPFGLNITFSDARKP